MVDDVRYDEELNKLVHEIWEIPLNEEPPLGDVPDFVKKKIGNRLGKDLCGIRKGIT